ncbi:hypothetical protein GCM10022275_22330 [Tessaracoccus defluvii]
MASKGLFGVPARPRRSARAVGQGRQMHRRATAAVVGALSCALVLMGGLASADSAAPTPDPATPVTTAAEPEATTPVESSDEATPNVPEATVGSEPTPQESNEDAQPEAEVTPAPETVASETESAPESSVEPSEDESLPADRPTSKTDAIMPLAAGPDGGTAPYVHWSVRDTAGNLVPGATFQFSYRNQSWFQWSWAQGGNANPLSDCTGSCGSNSLDRDRAVSYRGSNTAG